MSEPGSIPSVRIDALDPRTMELWRTVVAVAQDFERHDIRWCLVGGLMVALFAIEAGQVQRPTVDIDILADARQRPSATETVSARLVEMGGVLHEGGGLDAERGFRFDVGGQVVDVLAPDGLGRPAVTRHPLQTIEIPGGSQALRRTETVEVSVGADRARVVRPMLLGAVLLKARSLAVHSRPEDQRHDLLVLLGLMEDPRAAAEAMSAREAGWLRAVEPQLRLDDPDLTAAHDSGRLRVARAAYRWLVG